MSAFSTTLVSGLLITLSSCFGVQQSDGKAEPLVQVESSSAEEAEVELWPGISTMHQDQKGNYWFGGSSQGLFRYDGKKLETFTTADGICSLSINAIQEDDAGNLYFDTNDGICKYDGKTFSKLPMAAGPASENEWKLEPGDLWFKIGHDKKGPFRYDGKMIYPLELPKNQVNDNFLEGHADTQYQPYGTYSSYIDKQSRLWWGTASVGWACYDGTSVRWLYEEHLQSTPSGGAFGGRAMLQDSKGDYWFCNTRYRYKIHFDQTDPDHPDQLVYEKSPGLEYDDGEEVYHPYFMSNREDRNGDLWMVTYGDGVFRKNGQKLINYPMADGETEIFCWSGYLDNDGKYWLIPHDAGVYFWNGEAFEKFPHIKI